MAHAKAFFKNSIYPWLVWVMAGLGWLMIVIAWFSAIPLAEIGLHHPFPYISFQWVAHPSPDGSTVREPLWSSDGREVLIIAGLSYTGSYRNEHYAIDVNTGDVRHIPSEELELRDWLPDDTRIVSFTYATDPNTSETTGRLLTVENQQGQSLTQIALRHLDFVRATHVNSALGSNTKISTLEVLAPILFILGIVFALPIRKRKRGCLAVGLISGTIFLALAHLALGYTLSYAMDSVIA